MSREPKESAGAIFARMRAATHEFGDVAEVSVQNDGAVELNFDRASVNGDFLIIPLARSPAWQQPFRKNCRGTAADQAWRIWDALSPEPAVPSSQRKQGHPCQVSEWPVCYCHLVAGGTPVGLQSCRIPCQLAAFHLCLFCNEWRRQSLHNYQRFLAIH